MNPTHATWIRLVAQEGWTEATVAADYGVTRQAVSDALKRHGVDAHALRVARRQAERDAKDLDRTLEAMAAARPCPVCGGWVIRKGRTCSSDCTETWRTHRRLLSDEAYERQRIYIAHSILRRPESRTHSEIVWAHRMLSADPPPPNRRYIVAGSAAHAFATASPDVANL